jgi:hypothetical protein
LFIELAEYLKCPVEHEDAYLVLATGAMKGRAIRYGTLGCPVCRAEYLIVQQCVRFGPPPGIPEGRRPSLEMPAAEAVQALIALESPGGYVALVGSAVDLAGELAAWMPNVHFVCVNAPEGTTPSLTRSLLESTATIPLRDGVVRGVVLGGEYPAEPWEREAARVTLRGQRVVVLRESVVPPSGLAALAAGQGMWVGRRT